jgi:hypothetical protein
MSLVSLGVVHVGGNGPVASIKDNGVCLCLLGAAVGRLSTGSVELSAHGVA